MGVEIDYQKESSPKELKKELNRDKDRAQAIGRRITIVEVFSIEGHIYTAMLGTVILMLQTSGHDYTVVLVILQECYGG